MKFIDEYRDASSVRQIARAITECATRPWTLMEICGGQTHSIVRFGLEELLPASISLVHGPGCPVCVTPVERIDAAISLALRQGVTLCSFGDMLRVPGSDLSLQAARARGADVRIVYSPLDAVEMATRNPSREVVFFAVGFETTAPASALAVRQAERRQLRNFSLLVSQVRVPPAIEALLSASDNAVQGFLAAGHVCTVMGVDEYHALAARYRVPIVVTGFEPVDILRGVLGCVQQLESGEAHVSNAYGRAVRPEGNPQAQRLMGEVFELADQHWRGLGLIPRSGLTLRPAYAQFDALRRFPLALPPALESGDCWAGQILRGRMRPIDCPAFRLRCTPEHPVGAPMVSSEGACAAYYRYHAPARPGGAGSA